MAKARSKRPNQPSARQLHQTEIEEVRRRYDEIEAIMADLDPFRDLLEQAGFTVSRPDEPAVPESMEPAAVAGEPSDEELKAAFWKGYREASMCGATGYWVAGLRAVARLCRPATPSVPPEGELSTREAEAQDSFTRIRDSVLNGIDGFDNDQINGILSIIDTYTPDWV